ncbi:MAG: Ku protein [Saprospiraceae bacterium]|nr:Ku protein [Saprospiraceae bacterium]MBK8671096.1 Ku protein [Saprospiraceae bacterium]MBP6796311.1 Ku protein [Saprospiraceae bacterium]
MRSIWKGHIRFSLVTIPVVIFNGLEAENELSFKQLHDKDNGKINYKKVCSSCQEEVPFGNIVKGYEYESERFVVFKKEELETIKLKSTKVIDIEAFVDISEVHPSRYEALYFIGPNGEIANPTYNLLKHALLQSGKAGVGRIVLREREDVVLLMPEKDGIIMYKIRYPYEVRNISEIPDVKPTPVDDAQLNLANTLINSMVKPFSEVVFLDHYRDAVLNLVQQKVSGKEIVSIDSKEESVPVVDIMEALKRSIEEAKLKKGA